MTIRRAALLAAAVLTTASCVGGSGGHAGTPSPSARGPEVIEEAPALRPLALDPKPLWNTRTRLGMKVVDGAVLRGDAEIIEGQDSQGHSRLTVVDARTGRTRWSVEGYGPLRGGRGAEWRDSGEVAGAGEDWGILVDYFKTACRAGLCPLGKGPSDETGVALLSGKDGTVRWKVPLVPARTGAAARSANRLRGALVTSDDKVTLVTVAPSSGLASIGDVRLIALDTATGRRLWSRSGIQPSTIAAGTVFGRVSNGARTPSIQLNSGSVIALDLMNGRTRWDLSARVPGSFPMFAAAGMVLARQATASGTLGPPTLFDAATGREIARIPGVITDCKTDNRSLIACTETGTLQNHLVTVGLGDKKVRVAKRPLPGSLSLKTVWQGRIFLESFDGGGGLEVDRSANELAHGLPGHPVDISDRYAIFADQDSTKTGYTTRRLS